MSTLQLLDAAGRRRSPATLPGFHAGRPPRNKGFRYPPDPPRVEEIVAVMRRAGNTDHGLRLRALIVVLWRAGLRIGEAMALTEPDIDPGRGSILVRQGKGGKRREVGMDNWGFDQLQPWLARRLEMPVGTLFCVIDGQTRGRPWTPAAARNHLRRISTKAGVRRRFAPHQLRHAHAVEMAREGVSLKVIQTPARPRQPRRDIGLSRRHRHRGDHRHRPQPARADDLRERRTEHLSPSALARMGKRNRPEGGALRLSGSAGARRRSERAGSPPDAGVGPRSRPRTVVGRARARLDR